MFKEKFFSTLIDLVSEILEEEIIQTLFLDERELFFSLFEIKVDHDSTDMSGECILVGDCLTEKFLEDIDIVLPMELIVLGHKLEGSNITDKMLGDILDSGKHSLLGFHLLDSRVHTVGHSINELLNLTIVGLGEIKEESLVQ